MRATRARHRTSADVGEFQPDGARHRVALRACVAALAMVLFVPAGRATDQPPPVHQASAQNAIQPTPTATGLPIPRFASLKADNVNLRQGPGSDYRILWIFKRAGLPIEVLREHEVWRQVRDADGITGWVLSSLLSGRRTVVVAPWNIARVEPGAEKPVAVAPLPLRQERGDDARIVAELEVGVLATVTSCDGRWCRLAVEDYRGYIEQTQLWGVYDGEIIR